MGGAASALKGFLKSGGGKAAAKGLAGKAIPAVSVAGKAVGVAGAAGSAVNMGAGIAVGQTIGRAFDAIKDPGFVLFIAGLITFFFNEYASIVTLGIAVATIFMIYSALFILKAKGIVTVIIFWIWYIFMGGVTDISTIKYSIIPIFLTGIIVHGLITRFSGEHSFGKGATGELALGLIPIAFFFLDVGLVEWLFREFGWQLSNFTANILLFTPWWAYLGLMTTKKENLFISIAKFVGIVYIVVILTFGIVPSAYGQARSAVPGPEQLMDAKKEMREQLPDKENPFVSYMKCMMEQRYDDTDGCVQEKQETAELRSICSKREDVQVGSKDLDECLEEEREKKKEEKKTNVKGGIEQAIKVPTTAVLEIADSRKLLFKRAGEELNVNYPAKLTVENPREQEIRAEVSCVFVKKKALEEMTENVTGEVAIRGDQTNSVMVIGKNEKIPLICTPESDLNGTYHLEYKVLLSNLKTPSFLKRVVLGEHDISQKDDLIEETWKDEFPSASDIPSKSPKEFVRINFGFGITENTPVMSYDDMVFFDSAVENIGKGKLRKIRSYKFDMGERGFSVKNGPDDCLQGVEPYFPEDRKEYPLRNCFLEIPESFRYKVPHDERTYVAELHYDYEISKEMKIEVRERE